REILARAQVGGPGIGRRIDQCESTEPFRPGQKQTRRGGRTGPAAGENDAFGVKVEVATQRSNLLHDPLDTPMGVVRRPVVTARREPLLATQCEAEHVPLADRRQYAIKNLVAFAGIVEPDDERVGVIWLVAF